MHFLGCLDKWIFSLYGPVGQVSQTDYQNMSWKSNFERRIYEEKVLGLFHTRVCAISSCAISWTRRIHFQRFSLPVCGLFTQPIIDAIDNINDFDAGATFFQGTRTQKIENHLNPLMLVFIGKFMLITNKWVPMYWGFRYSLAFFALFCINQMSH